MTTHLRRPSHVRDVGRSDSVIHLEEDVAGSSPAAWVTPGVAQLAERLTSDRTPYLRRTQLR